MTWVWYEGRFPVLIREKVVTFSFLKAGVCRPTNGTLVSGWTGSYHSEQQLHTCMSCQQSGKFKYSSGFYHSSVCLKWFEYTVIQRHPQIKPPVQVFLSLMCYAGMMCSPEHYPGPWAAELPSVWVPELFWTDAVGPLEAVLLGETSKALVLLLAALLFFSVNQKLPVSINPFSKE